MPLNHYLPATYLASFSNENTLPRRKRMLTVGDLVELNIFQSPASNIGAINNFYGLRENSQNNFSIDDIWGGYEKDLAGALENLINKTITALEWAHILVPFVTSMLVRGKDFNLRFGKRLSLLQVTSYRDNTNLARMMELQRLLAPVLAANWIVMSATGDGNVITNDIGFTPYKNLFMGDTGLAFPVTKNHILGLVPERFRRIAYLENGAWFPIIHYHDLPPGNHLQLNSSMAKHGFRFIYGSDTDSIKPHLVKRREPPPLIEPGMIGFLNDHHARVHEFTWHRLIGSLRKSPFATDSWDFTDIDWAAIKEGWIPPVIFPTNTPFYPPALRRDNEFIYVNLYYVPSPNRSLNMGS